MPSHESTDIKVRVLPLGSELTELGVLELKLLRERFNGLRRDLDYLRDLKKIAEVGGNQELARGLDRAIGTIEGHLGGL